MYLKQTLLCFILISFVCDQPDSKVHFIKIWIKSNKNFYQSMTFTKLGFRTYIRERNIFSCIREILIIRKTGETSIILFHLYRHPIVTKSRYFNAVHLAGYICCRILVNSSYINHQASPVFNEKKTFYITPLLCTLT